MFSCISLCFSGHICSQAFNYETLHSVTYSVLGEANTDLHIDGCVPLDESPFIVADPVVVHAVPSVQECPVCGQLDHHILSGVTAGGLIRLCRMKQKAA